MAVRVHAFKEGTKKVKGDEIKNQNNTSFNM